MKNRKYSLVFIMLLCMIMAVSAFPMTVNADMGPKASVRIQFEHMGDELCYGTLLSKEKSTGPASAWDGRTESAQKEYMDPGIWEIFVNYKDPDGYYFLQRSWKVSESKELAWTYYPPDDFKILLYYPETETFVSSGIYARYAFDTYYTVDMDGVDIGSVEYNDDLSTNERIEAYRSYNYRQEMLALGARIVLTILIEMLVALLLATASAMARVPCEKGPISKTPSGPFHRMVLALATSSVKRLTVSGPMSSPIHSAGVS